MSQAPKPAQNWSQSGLGRPYFRITSQAMSAPIMPSLATRRKVS